MKNAVAIGAAAIAVSAAMLAAGFVSARQAADAGPPATRTAGKAPVMADAGRENIETVVRDYLLSNPELLLDVQEALQIKQEEAKKLAQSTTIRDAAKTLFEAEYDGVVGNPDGAFTVVEFFDYNCGYCKRALPDMEEMTATDPEVRFVLKEFPILGPDSQAAHVVSMAFRNLMPEKYDTFHRQLLGGAGRANEESAMKLALELGADEKALRAEMENPAIMQAFNETYELANRLAITGTPSYVVGEEVVFGALGRDVLEEKVANLRECGAAVC
ncbi:DsbA family protein [Mesorhizobium xinjiangense]|uniref:DsbA family protein n=1 Tax=Mesorhizobium xinjiangense TaxID=2678685 RepID=UPI0012EEA73B|nr:DsbA family protein [Mesorhizobium xinjiangense]